MTLSHWLGWAGLSVAAYAAGSIPFGLLIGRLRGVDVRTVGSCNIGATNVFRTVGKRWGLLTFTLDAFKGFVPAFFFPRLLAQWTMAPTGRWAPLPGLLFMALSLAGHTWPVWLHFRGGKGVATSAGALLGVAPLEMAIGLAVWALAFVLFRYVSLASLLATAAVCVSAWILESHEGVLLPLLLSLMGVLVVIRHRANIRRLLNGTEHRATRQRERPS